MLVYTLNPLSFALNVLTGSIGYYQQAYMMAPNRKVMKFISYAGLTNVMEALKPYVDKPILNVATGIFGFITNAAGIDTIKKYNRIDMAKKIYGHEGKSLKSIMFIAQAAYIPYLAVGIPVNWIIDRFTKQEKIISN